MEEFMGNFKSDNLPDLVKCFCSRECNCFIIHKK